MIFKICWDLSEYEELIDFFLVGEMFVGKRNRMEGKSSRTILDGGKIKSPKWGSLQIFRALLQLFLYGYPQISQMLPARCLS